MFRSHDLAQLGIVFSMANPVPRKGKPPTVFISYAHDSAEHKRWVAELASTLVENGIDVTLGQWDLRLGDDVAKFMERSIARVDRVLMVCTDRYVEKLNASTGGAGYEGMIVTGEMLKDLGTARFIPVVRQEGDVILPRSLKTRMYVNAGRSASFREGFEQLLRELHNSPVPSRPVLGKNPFVEGHHPQSARVEKAQPRRRTPASESRTPRSFARLFVWRG
jgi:hypothetical protein